MVLRALPPLPFGFGLPSAISACPFSHLPLYFVAFVLFCPPAWLLSFLYAVAVCCMPCWRVPLDPSNGRQWHLEQDLTGSSCCAVLTHVYTDECTCKHAAVLLHLCAPCSEWLWCSFGSSTGSSLIREPLDWRNQTPTPESRRRGGRQVGSAARVRPERTATLSHFLPLFSN